MGECRKPADVKCPKGVTPPLQDVAETDYDLFLGAE